MKRSAPGQISETSKPIKCSAPPQTGIGWTRCEIHTRKVQLGTQKGEKYTDSFAVISKTSESGNMVEPLSCALKFCRVALMLSHLNIYTRKKPCLWSVQMSQEIANGKANVKCTWKGICTHTLSKHSSLKHSKSTPSGVPHCVIRQYKKMRSGVV